MTLKVQEMYVKTLPSEIKNTLVWYTKPNYYKKFNTSMRKGFMLNTEEIRRLRDLESAFENVPILSEPIVVYRGVKNEDEIVSDRAYMSTSLDIDTALGFSSCCLMEITLSSGCKVLPIYSISDSPEELEVLVDRGQGLFVIGMKLKGSKKIYSVNVMPPNTIQVESGKISEIEGKMNMVVMENVAGQIVESLSEESEMIENENDLRQEINFLYKGYRSKLDNLPKEIPNGVLEGIVEKVKKVTFK